MALYSDQWLRKGYKSGPQVSISNSQPVYFRYWYDGDRKVGATIDFEYADDAHYEFQWEDFEKLIMLWGGEDRYVSGMQMFFDSQQAYHNFSSFLSRNNIAYTRIAFY